MEANAKVYSGCENGPQTGFGVVNISMICAHGHDFTVEFGFPVLALEEYHVFPGRS